MSEPIIVVKSRKHMEHFDIDKLHRSLVATCHSLKTPDGQAEDTARQACDAVVMWLDNKPEVTTDDIRQFVSNHLDKSHPEAGFIYRRHRFII